MMPELVVKLRLPHTISEGEKLLISRYYRKMFDKKHFAVFTKTMEILTRRQVINGDKVPDYRIDNTGLAMPIHPSTGETAIRWHHPEVTHRIIGDRVTAPGSITILLADPDTSKLYGLFICETTTVRSFMISNGWHNPLVYAGCQAKRKFRRSLSGLIRQINYHLEQQWQKKEGSLLDKEKPSLQMDETVLAPNCIAVSPEARNGMYLKEIYSCFLNALTEEQKQLKMISETAWNSKISTLTDLGGMVACGVIRGADVEPGPRDSSIVVGDYQSFVKMEEFYDAISPKRPAAQESGSNRAQIFSIRDGLSPLSGAEEARRGPSATQHRTGATAVSSNASHNLKQETK